MNVIRDEGDARRALASLHTLFADSKWRLSAEDLDPLAEGCKFELNVEWGKLLLSVWSDSAAYVYRVVAFEVADNFVRLQARKGIARAPLIITFCRTNSSAASERVLFLRRLKERLKELDPTSRVISSTAGAHRMRALRTGYARLVLSRAGITVLVVAVGDLETQQTIDGIVEVALIWASQFNGARESQSRATELWLVIPEGKARTIMERLTLLAVAHLGVRVLCLEMNAKEGTLEFVSISAQMELLALHPRRLRWGRRARITDESRELTERIRMLAPEFIEVREMNISGGERFVIHGLEFARWSRNPRRGLWFGVHEWKELTQDNFGELARLVEEIAVRRSAEASDRRHNYYRLREEAWLESVIRQDITSFDPCLDPRFVYSQIPAWRGDDRSVLDVLTIDGHGRLVILEIKASEDPMLPLQGLDYWMRVEQARRQRQFYERRMFTGVEIADATPLLYLVSPRLRFHRNFAEITRCISPEVEAWRVAVNSNWRTQLRVLARERVNQGQGTGT